MAVSVQHFTAAGEGMAQCVHFAHLPKVMGGLKRKKKIFGWICSLLGFVKQQNFQYTTGWKSGKMCALYKWEVWNRKGSILFISRRAGVQEECCFPTLYDPRWYPPFFLLLQPGGNKSIPDILPLVTIASLKWMQWDRKPETEQSTALAPHPLSLPLQT